MNRIPGIVPLGLAACLLGFGAASAPAQTAEPDNAGAEQVYGDWLLRCAETEPTRCELTQRIIHSETRAMVAEIAIAPVGQGQEGYALVLSVPEGADLAASPAFKLDGRAEQAAMVWRVCFNAKCQANAVLSDAGVAAMSEAGRAIFGYRKYGATSLTVTAVSFNGFAEGLTALAAL